MNGAFGSWVTGPLIDITVFGDNSGDEQALVGIIDTGASVICIDKRIPLRLGLTPTNLKTMVVADGSEILATVFTGEISIPELDFLEAENDG